MIRDVAGKVAVITGAAGGIGLGAARAFSAAGMRLVLADIDEARLATAVQELRDEGADVHGAPTDVTKRDSLEALRDTALARYGAAHLICSNAGGPIPRRIVDVTQSDWNWVLDLNFFGVVYGVQVFLPLLEEQGEGHLSATSSMSGLVPFPPVVTYNVAKAGVIAFMETLAHELLEQGSPVGVSVLCPGAVATRGVENAMRLAQATGHEPSPEEIEVASVGQASLLSGGIDPVEAGHVLLDGIRQGRFWIFTHPGWIDGPLKQRHEAMTRDGALIDL
jgi:NAD(P)-dependent dehydrogenase (short-subunit alcohol dehydrogenase family)